MPSGRFSVERRLPANPLPEGLRCVRFYIPDDNEWEDILLGQLEPLQRWMTWARDEAKTGRIVAKRWREALYTYMDCDDNCAAPFWYDSPDEAEEDCDPDEEDTALWNVADWAVSAFLFTTATPGAALVYKTIAPKIRNFFRAPSAGALCEIVINGVLWGTIPTSAAANAVPVGSALPVTLDIAAHNIAHNIIPFPVPANIEYIHRLAAVGGGEPLPPQQLQLIRSRVKPPVLCDAFEVKPDWEQLALAWFECYGDELPMAQLRQKPGNPCILQQNTLTGWQDVFDYSLCQPNQNLIQNSTFIDSVNILNQYNQTWNSNPTINNFAPDLVYDADPVANEWRNAAVCYAFQGLYAIIVEAREAQLSGGDVADVVLALFGAAMAAAATVVSMGAASVALVGAVTYLAPKLAFLVGASYTADQMREYEPDILCCFYSAVKDSDLTESAFNTALDGCMFTGAMEDVRATVAAFLQDHDIYLSFLKLATEGYQNAEAGFLAPCPCDISDYCQDFTLTDGSFTPVSTPINGDWVTMVGWKPELDTANKIRQLWITRTLAGASSVTSVKITYDAVSPGTFDGSARPVGIRGYLGATLVFDQEETISYGTDLEYSWAGNETIDRLELILVPANLAGSGTIGGDATLKKLEISGTDLTEWGISNC